MMQTVSFTANGFAVSVTNGVVNGFAKIQAYRTFLGKIMAEREGAYFHLYGQSSAEVNDPRGILDKRQRAIVTAVSDGFSDGLARLSVKEFLPTLVNGVVSLTANPLYGTVAAYREEKSRLFHGLKMHIGERKSGKRRKRVKKVTAWTRRYEEV